MSIQSIVIPEGVSAKAAFTRTGVTGQIADLGEAMVSRLTPGDGEVLCLAVIDAVGITLDDTVTVYLHELTVQVTGSASAQAPLDFEGRAYPVLDQIEHVFLQRLDQDGDTIVHGIMDEGIERARLQAGGSAHFGFGQPIAYDPEAPYALLLQATEESLGAGSIRVIVIGRTME